MIIYVPEIRKIVELGVYCADIKRYIPTEALLWLQNGIGWFLLREYTVQSSSVGIETLQSYTHSLRFIYTYGVLDIYKAC